MNNQKNRKNKSSGALWIVAAVALIAANLGEGDASSIAVLGLILVIAAAAVAVTAAKKRQTKAASAGNSAQQVSMAEKLRRFGRDVAQEDHCDFGSANCGYSHDRERRLAQLDGFLKNGLISKEEYMILYEKFSKSTELN